jgi:hypothetical protein
MRSPRSSRGVAFAVEGTEREVIVLRISGGVNDRIRWFALAVVVVALVVALGVGLGFVRSGGSNLVPSTSFAPARVVSPVATSASDQPASISRMDLQIHEQDYCQCHG